MPNQRVLFPYPFQYHRTRCTAAAARSAPTDPHVRPERTCGRACVPKQILLHMRLATFCRHFANAVLAVSSDRLCLPLDSRREKSPKHPDLEAAVPDWRPKLLSTTPQTSL
ncbi:uncharacterized protein PV07_09553 [Cladophialophora immunda]|uniref:Uncharacterized protein n=1 Tax=Cladophialophora immunda TaxID=569365 RepID=A0A0D2C7K6_9EURO|nr:uncharacterized protein PV07_09553 [Cladophialophora immunda]KIW26460.1 hypothetical protein PV07_09553 [Cladophialophora immunda]